MKFRAFKIAVLQFVSVVAMLSFAFSPLAPVIEVKKAEAQWAVVEIGANLFMNTMQKIKDIGLDGIAWSLANTFLQQMVRDTTRWINTGFKGSPMYITNLNEFMTGVADQVAGKYLTDIGLGFICSPFRFNIQAALNLEYQGARSYNTPICTLSAAVGNVEAFLAGDFIGGGGWDMWRNITLVNQNNPYGATLTAHTGLYARIANAQGEEYDLLAWADGLFGQKECTDENDPTTCRTVTPGAVVTAQLNHVLGLPGDRIALADEIDEMIGALIGQLINKLLAPNGGGLRGMSPSYFEAANAQERMVLESRLASSINDQVGAKQQQLTIENDVVSQITLRESACTADRKRLSDSLSRTRVTATANIATLNSEIQYLRSIDIQTADPNQVVSTITSSTATGTNLAAVQAEINSEASCVN